MEQETVSFALRGSVARLHASATEIHKRYISASLDQGRTERLVRDRLFEMADTRLHSHLGQAMGTLFTLGTASFVLRSEDFESIEAMHSIIYELCVSWAGVVAVETSTETAGREITVHLTAVNE